MANESTKLIDNIKNGVLRKFPLLGVTMSKLNFLEDSTAPTAQTDGKSVYYNLDFINSLSPDGQITVFAHEIMHVAFNHIARSKNKDLGCWNIATDAVINQMLKSQNLLFDNWIDMPEAKGKSAEEMYQKLLEKQKQSEQNKSSNQGEQQNNEENNKSNSGKNNKNKRWKKKKSLSDWFKEKKQKGNNQSEPNNGNVSSSKEQSSLTQNHEIWKEAVKKAEKFERRSHAKINSSENQKNVDYSKMEEDFSNKNQEMKVELGKEIREKLKSKSTHSLGNMDLTYVKPVVTWDKILKRELESEEENWSFRRADEDNFFQSRIEDVERSERAKTEVLIDTSGSVSDSLVICFLRQLKCLIKESKLKVGCFDTRFYGFKEIKNEKDIENFQVVGRGGTDFELAVKNFSSDPKINKIVFTDGYDKMNLQDKKFKNIIWIVYRNTEFQPAVGKVIAVTTNEIRHNPNKKSTNFNFSM